jgi:hypothetical protein
MRVHWIVACFASVPIASLSAQSAVESIQSSTAEMTHASAPGVVFDGRILDAIEFFRPHRTGNGRSCATCHRPEDHFALTPATVEARYQAWQARRRRDPTADDPLFRSIDADDFDQDFTTLRTKPSCASRCRCRRMSSSRMTRRQPRCLCGGPCRQWSMRV